MNIVVKLPGRSNIATLFIPAFSTTNNFINLNGNLFYS